MFSRFIELENITVFLVALSVLFVVFSLVALIELKSNLTVWFEHATSFTFLGNSLPWMRRVHEGSVLDLIVDIFIFVEWERPAETAEQNSSVCNCVLFI